MKTWQIGIVAVLIVCVLGVVVVGLYLVMTETSREMPILATAYVIPTQHPTTTPLPPCDKPTVSAWINRLEIRQNELNEDLDVILIVQSPNPDDYIPLANRAKSRYDAQRLEQTPDCLSSLQALMTEAFYYNWQGLDALTRGDWDKGASDIQIMTDKLETAEAAINAAIELGK